ncbi:MAG: cytochrome c oxidase subunit II [Opitutales bacterium]|jgi:cytochrome c oxidase subunit II|nr:cytochrome c oxidase subunit II [Opitutales bacterium]MDP4658446.1 cytochrome c oxidase subunit II [Opitutales bacterium]MDP4774926.1 cytochrome c oxidase subunit II [Opitutales bacterium]MDP4786880.1 cytochrome c oxidase subunit II [Opitutales bacterium]MDP4860584.1 cytochrome c oxidase subunit II [Opitutales bacterium]
MFSRILSRVGLLAALSLAFIMAGCSKEEMTVRQSTLDPKGPVAQVQFDVFMDTVWLVVVLFALVGGMLVYAVIKFRSRPGDEDKPVIVEDGHGNPLIEIGLITASIGALVIIAIPTLSAIWYTDDVPAAAVPTSKLSAWYPRVEGTRENYAQTVEEQVLEVDVIGKQWWFRFEYPQLGMTNDAKHSVPNELVIPKGKAVRINLRSEDVIHSFWVPKIAGKVDLMPGRKNHMWIQADQTGHYYGQCAEFCGDSHAYMLFRVEVLEPADFAKWVQKQKADAAPVAAGSAAEKGKALFAAKSCVMCHNVGGHFGAGAFGPDLTHVASRKSLAGAWLDNRDVAKQRALEQSTGNTENSVPVDEAKLKANLIKWIGSSGVAHGADGKLSKDVKPGNRMHYYKMFNVAGLRETNQQFTAEELDHLAEYLLTLK